MSFHIGGDSQKNGWVISITFSNILSWLIHFFGGNPADFQAKIGIGILLIDKRQGLHSKLSIALTGGELSASIIWRGQRLSLYDVFLSSFSVFLPACAAA